jgi:hypothetical protein
MFSFCIVEAKKRMSMLMKKMVEQPVLVACEVVITDDVFLRV